MLSVAVLFLALSLGARTSYGTSVGLQGSVALELGYAAPDVPRHVLPTDWLTRFEPPKGERTTERLCHVTPGLRVSIQPTVWLEDLELSTGLVIAYRLTAPGLIDQSLRVTKYDWWDSVRLKATELRRVTPDVGAFVSWQDWHLAVTASWAQVRDEDYQGKDCSGCRNSSRVVESTTLEELWVWRADVRATLSPPEVPTFDVGVFFELAHRTMWQVGLVAAWQFVVLGDRASGSTARAADG